MIRAIHKRLEEREEGFTLIELLVVVIIIGILAAIAIPTFLNQRERGWEADAQSVVRNAAIAMESCSVQANGNYALCDQAALVLEGFNFNATNFPTANLTITPAATSYTINAYHALGGDQFTLTSTNGTVTRSARP